MPRPSLYETLFGNFAGGLDLRQVSEENQASSLPDTSMT